MQAKQWIEHFLENRGLTYNDICQNTKPLYQYRVTDDEFEFLKQTLKLSAHLGVQHIFKGLQLWDAAFVLYAAEWWRREYDGSSWKWENIFASFDADVKELSTSQRNLLVEKGLSYWYRKLRLVNGRRRYLGSIAIEGGLPLRQLSNAGTNGGWLGRVFKQAIPKYIKFKSSGVTATEIVGEYASYFPQTFRNEDIYFILGDMLDVVVSLKVSHKLHKHTKPIEYLNQHVQGWQEQFPLPINNEISARLLSEMITTAAAASDIKSKAFSVRRFLNKQYHLEMVLEFERFIALKTIFSGIPEANIPLRLEVEIISDNKNISSLGYALKTNYKGTPSLKMPCVKYDVHLNKAYLSHLIRFKYLAEVVKEIPLIGAESLDNEVPWVFSLQDERWVLEGSASVSTRAKQVRVLYPDSLSCESENQEYIATIEQKKLIEASGIIYLTASSDTTYRISTGQAHAAEYYYLDGKRVPFNSFPQELYTGLPKLKCLNTETAVLKEIPTTELVAKRFHSAEAWKPLSQAKQGIYEIRYKGIDSSIKFRKKCVLLPENFLIRLKPQRNSLNGCIYLDNIGEAELICETDIRHDISKVDQSIQVELFVDGIPPSFIHLNLRWKGQPETLRLNTPFPVQGGFLMSPKGQRLPKSYSLFADNLYGFRLYLLNEKPARKKEIQIEFTLVDKHIDSTKSLYFRHNIKYEGALFEIAIINYLEWIKALVAVSQDLDSYIQLIVYQGGFNLMTVNIYQYQMSLERNTLEGSVELAYNDSTQCSQKQISAVKLNAMRLSQPEERHIELEQQLSENTQIGSWFFYPEKRVAEPWLIYPCPDSSISFRPILWVGENEAITANLNPLEISTLHSAVMIESFKLRALVINKILAQMCFDFNHSGWNYLKMLTQETEHLPLNSFHVWALIATNHQVLAATVLQVEQGFIDKLNTELPIFWELITLADWLVVFKQYQLYLQNLLGDEGSYVHDLLESRINHLDFLPDSMGIVKRALKWSLLGISGQELSFMATPNAINTFVIPQLDQARHELDRRQADNQWFITLKNELHRYWYDMQPSSQQLLKISEVSEHHLPTLMLPIILANFCLTESPKKWSADVVHIFQLKQLKSFDEEWFNTAFLFSLAYLSQQPENFSRLQDKLVNMEKENEFKIQKIEQDIMKLEQFATVGE